MVKIENTYPNAITSRVDSLYRIMEGINVCLCGGSALKALLGMPLDTSDYDFWLSSAHEVVIAREKIIASGLMLKCTTENALTFASVFNNDDEAVQLIFNQYHSSIQSIFDTFDIDLVKVAYVGGAFYVDEGAIETIITGKINKITQYDKISSDKYLSRLRKYTEAGYQFSIDSVRSAVESGILEKYDRSTSMSSYISGGY